MMCLSLVWGDGPSSRGRAVSGIATGGVSLVKYQPFLHLLWSYAPASRLGIPCTDVKIEIQKVSNDSKKKRP